MMENTTKWIRSRQKRRYPRVVIALDHLMAKLSGSLKRTMLLRKNPSLVHSYQFYF